MTKPSVTVIVAQVDGGSLGSIEGFRREAEEFGGDVLVVEGQGSLVPELWRDGLERTDSKFVVFTTSAMVPRPGWLRGLIGSIDSPGVLAVGGAIVPGANLSALDGAIYVSRYLNYLQPRDGTLPAGENAAYRIEALARISQSWSEGFWEAEVHPHLAKGESNLPLNRAIDPRFALDCSAVLEYSGSASLGETLGRRFRHGRRYGATRPRGRLGPFQALACPMILPLLAWRTWKTMRRVGRPAGIGWRSLFPWAAITLAWSLGEGVGLAFRRRRVAVAIPSVVHVS